MTEKKSLAGRLAQTRAAYLRKFGREEDGSVIAMTLLLLIIMLVLGGMAVDFMRFESRRSLLQSVSDRSVLAAAKLGLDPSLDPEGVVVDYFEKAGFGGAIQGSPTVTNVGGSRSVSVEANLDLDTYYLRYIGIDSMAAPASATAVEGSGSVEISLVLDISGSMETSFTDVDGTSKTQMEALQEGAELFVNTVVTPDNEGQVTLSLVPYSDQVNIGPAIFNAINTSDPSGTLNFTPVPVQSVGTGPVTATCVYLPDDALFETTAFDAARVYQQVRQAQFNQAGRGGFTNNGVSVPSTRDWRIGTLDQPLCPIQTYERIIPVSDNEAELVSAIQSLRPTGGTSIHLGLRWGVTLLDSSFEPTMSSISNTGVLPANAPLARHTDLRPAAYREDDPTINSAKYIVLFTDGQNSDGRPVRDELYDTSIDIRDLFNTYNYTFLQACAFNYINTANGATTDWIDICNDIRTNALTGQPDTEFFEAFGPDTDLADPTNSTRGWSDAFNAAVDTDVELAATRNDRLRDLCDAAKDRNIIIYTIALNASATGQAEMQYCATREDSELYYYQAAGDNLVDIFETIAEQITALRLTL